MKTMGGPCEGPGRHLCLIGNNTTPSSVKEMVVHNPGLMVLDLQDDDRSHILILIGMETEVDHRLTWLHPQVLGKENGRLISNLPRL